MTATPEPVYYEPTPCWSNLFEAIEASQYLNHEGIDALLAQSKEIALETDFSWGIRYKGDTRSLNWKLHRVMFYGVALLFRKAIAGGKERE
jgi:hypothetical protein